jgi:hypothetical protein
VSAAEVDYAKGPRIPTVQPKRCACGEEILDARWERCNSCERDLRGPFSYGEDE